MAVSLPARAERGPPGAGRAKSRWNGIWGRTTVDCVVTASVRAVRALGSGWAPSRSSCCPTARGPVFRVAW